MAKTIQKSVKKTATKQATTAHKTVAKAKTNGKKTENGNQIALAASMAVGNFFVVAQFASVGLEAIKTFAKEHKDDKEVAEYLKANEPVVKSFLKFVQKLDTTIKRREHMLIDGASRPKMAAKAVTVKKAVKKGAK